MKILFIYRLFSGLERSFAEGRWRPGGAPTVYKLVEAMDAGDMEVRFVFTAKDPMRSLDLKRDRTVDVDGLKHPVHLIAGDDRWFFKRRRLRRLATELRQFIALWAILRREKPDAVYIGNANVWFAGVAARLLRAPVVFRVMGVYEAMWKILDDPGTASRLLRWLYRAPFALVVATQDGSGFERWAGRAINRNSRIVQMLNGVDAIPDDVPAAEGLDGFDEDAVLVLFVGRLEAVKGARTFVEAALAVGAETAGKVQAVVVGSGGLEDELRALAADHPAGHMIRFTGQIPHDRILALQMRADIYVSLNEQGNLSNANLEAIRAGRCMILPASQPISGIDIATDDLLPPHTALRIPSATDTPSLIKAILHLVRNSEERAARAEATRARAAAIGNWEERIAAEVEQLRALAPTPPTPPTPGSREAGR